MNHKIRGVLLIAVGLLMSVSAAIIFARYEYQADIAGDNADILLGALREEIQVRQELSRYDPAQQESATTELPKLTIEPKVTDPAEIMFQGYTLVGIVRVPSMGLELPVLDTWNYDLLQIAPCRYSGSVAGRDLILLGHNYARHFAPLKQAAIGEIVEFCNINGIVYRYEIAATEILQKTDVERLTTSGYDLTLFTCTNGGYSRYVVRCMQIPAEDLSNSGER